MGGTVLMGGSVPILGNVLVVGSVPPVPDVSVLTAIPPSVGVGVSALVGVVPMSVPSRFVARVTSSVTMGLAGETARTGAVKSFDSRRALSTEIDWGRAGSGPGPAFTVMLSRTPTGVAGPTALPVTGSRRATCTRPRGTVMADAPPTTPPTATAPPCPPTAIRGLVATPTTSHHREHSNVH